MTNPEPSDQSRRKASQGASANQDNREPIRSSFSLDRLDREDIRRVSDTLGVTQGEVVGRSALLFSLVAVRSLERRKQALPMLKTMFDQMHRSLESMKSLAPHLGQMIDSIGSLASFIVEAEKYSIDKKVIDGVDKDQLEQWENDCSTIGYVVAHQDPEYREHFSPFRVTLRQILQNISPHDWGLPEINKETGDFLPTLDIEIDF